jgi:hypothetical protein
MHGTQYHIDNTRLQFITKTQDTMILNSFINRKVKNTELSTIIFLLGGVFELFPLGRDNSYRNTWIILDLLIYIK